MKIYFLVLFLFLNSNLFSQQKDERIINAALKSESKTWTDKSGYHQVIIRESGLFVHPKYKHPKQGKDAELSISHSISKDTIQTIKLIHDSIWDCPFTCEAKFIHDSIVVTDLDKDKVNEVWLVYKTHCKNKLNPADINIVMFEGMETHIMKGKSKTIIGSDSRGNFIYSDGAYKFSPAFEIAPKVILDYAKRLWREMAIK